MKQLSLLDCHLQSESQNIIYYKGVFSANILSKISMNIRKQLSTTRKVAKRVFSIFLELGQNVALYSAETNNFGDGNDEHGVGVLMLDEQSDAFVLTVGNLIHQHKKAGILERIEKINRLNEQELRKLKIEQRGMPRAEGQGGANIGLIHVALQSGKPFTYEIQDMDDDFAFLILHVGVDKLETKI